MATINYVTKEGLAKLKAELQQLKGEERSKMAKAIAEAREKGDLSENAEYDAAKEAQGYLEAKIAQLESDLANARVMDDSMVDTSKAYILSTVRVKNLKLNKEFTYQLVSRNEVDIAAGRISVESPIGKGFLGTSVGDVVDIQVPAGVISFEVLEITRG